MPTPDWRHALRDLATRLAGTVEPITFVIGAGSSMSSGTPTTQAAFDSVAAHTSRMPAAAVRDRLHEVAPADRRAALNPLFRDIVPGIGYRALAALGRTRRVNVLNLNWDPLVVEACARLGVPCDAYDIRNFRDTSQPNCRQTPASRASICMGTWRMIHGSAEVRHLASHQMKFATSTNTIGKRRVSSRACRSWRIRTSFASCMTCVISSSPSLKKRSGRSFVTRLARPRTWCVEPSNCPPPT